MVRKNVLIVHPDEGVSQLLSARLARAGRFTINTACDGFDAAVRLFGTPCDCLILHLHTPSLDAHKVIKRIRAHGEMAEMPVIMLSPQRDRAVDGRLRGAGSLTLLYEPLDYDLLATTVKLMTGVSRPARHPIAAEGLSLSGAPAEVKGVERRRSNVARLDEIWNGIQLAPPIPCRLPGGLSAGGLPDGRLGNVDKDLIASDVGLAIRVLRAANSLGAVDGLLAAVEQVDQHAAGDDLVQSCAPRCPLPRATEAFLADTFSRHSLTVACLAEEVAAHQRFPQPDTVFVSGLLHDVGRLFLVHYFAEAYGAVMRHASDLQNPAGPPEDICAIERQILRIDHGVVGHELCKAWGLPAVVGAGTLHHELDQDRVRRRADVTVIRMIALADLIDRSMRFMPPAASSGSYVGETAEGVARRELEAFYQTIYGNVPFWVHEFLRQKHIPLRRMYELALHRVERAQRLAGVGDGGQEAVHSCVDRRR